jgi:hypothetical protein
VIFIIKIKELVHSDLGIFTWMVLRMATLPSFPELARMPKTPKYIYWSLNM